MRARIIFRGLTLFRFPEFTAGSIEGAKAGQNLGLLEAWLIQDRNMEKMPLHTHTPRLAYTGKDVDRKSAVVRHPEKFNKDLAIGLTSAAGAGVVVDSSFLDYVPRLGALYGENIFEPQLKAFAIRKITIHSGTIRAGNFISWEWHGNTPARVGYMNTSFQGFGANEVVVDVGDDRDFDDDAAAGYLGIDGEGVRLAPYFRRGETPGVALEDIEVNTAEVLITNLTARRRRPVFWGLHFQSLFDVAGFPRKAFDAAQWEELEEAARAYDAFEWDNDFEHMNQGKKVGQPFPYLINPRRDELDGIAEAAQRDTIVSPPSLPSGRRAGEAEEMHGGHDPVNTQLCPFGVI